MPLRMPGVSARCSGQNEQAPYPSKGMVFYGKPEDLTHHGKEDTLNHNVVMGSPFLFPFSRNGREGNGDTPEFCGSRRDLLWLSQSTGMKSCVP